MKRLLWLCARLMLVGGVAGWPAAVDGAEITGQVVLPPAGKATVLNRRYSVVVRGGVVALNPPLAVVYLEGRFDPLPAPPIVQITQKGLAFSPSLLAVQVGTRVEFPNLDETYHNIFSYSPPQRFDLGRYRPDERPIPSQQFDVPGLVTLRCDIHEHMRALILVVATPHFVVTDSEGRYRLTGVPAGRYVLKAWLSSTEVREHLVEVSDDAVLRVDFP
ncbi:MAG: carboxypeptidase regulatory-like domain-containing protein [Candidatus Didemnitutus sp.]|nr:carboxypeptidase regulatory-like domain-containing protein [Candidatus Didemnitutus sp.]